MSLDTTKVRPITPKGHLNPYEILGYGIFCEENKEYFVYNSNNLIKEEDKKLEIKENQIRDLKKGNLVAIVEYTKNNKKITDFFKAEEIK